VVHTKLKAILGGSPAKSASPSGLPDHSGASPNGLGSLDATGRFFSTADHLDDLPSSPASRTTHDPVALSSSPSSSSRDLRPRQLPTEYGKEYVPFTYASIDREVLADRPEGWKKFSVKGPSLSRSPGVETRRSPAPSPEATVRARAEDRVLYKYVRVSIFSPRGVGLGVAVGRRRRRRSPSVPLRIVKQERSSE
jgi:hypothetical protein